MKNASPKDMRVRAKHLLGEWRQNWLADPHGARDALDQANDLLALAEEAEKAGVR
jgi:hypothetical protein